MSIVKVEKRFWGSDRDATRHAKKINTANKDYNIIVKRFGPLYFVGTKEEFKEL